MQTVFPNILSITRKLVQNKIPSLFYKFYMGVCGPGSSVGVATDYGMDGPGIESR
jgi:hypothetical protein